MGRAKRPVFSSFLFVIILVLVAALPLDAQRSKKKGYAGPRARISVAEIKDQTASGGISSHWMERFRITWREIGEGMREMLVTALFQTKHFVLLDRDLLPEILKEQDMAGTGRVKEGTAPATGGIIGTDLLIIGAVTEFLGDAYTINGAADAWGTQVDGLVNKGYVFIQMTNYAAAVDVLSKALAINSASGPARLNRAISYLQLNQLDEAQSDYDALLLDPSHG